MIILVKESAKEVSLSVQRHELSRDSLHMDHGKAVSTMSTVHAPQSLQMGNCHKTHKVTRNHLLRDAMWVWRNHRSRIRRASCHRQPRELHKCHIQMRRLSMLPRILCSPTRQRRSIAARKWV